MADVWSIMRASRKRFIRKRAKYYCFPVVAVLGFMSWSIVGLIHNVLVLPSNPHTSISDFMEERLKETANPASTANESENAKEKRLFTNEPHNISFKHKTTLITTKTCMQQYFILILVSSAPSNLQRRKDIRQTWGVDTALKPRWKTVFLVAQTRVQNESDSLLKEEEYFQDLIRADYYDHYWNQTLKIQMGFEWAATYCQFSFLLKMDDDAFVFTKALISFLKMPSTPREKLYMGQVYRHPHVHRRGKWKITETEYNGTNYPPFCPGFGIVFSADIVHSFVDLFDVVPKFRLDDVYMGTAREQNWRETTR